MQGIRRNGGRSHESPRRAAAEALGPVSDAAAGISTSTLHNAVLLPAIAALSGLGGLRAYLYARVEYITAAMLSNHVPKGGNGASVVQLGGGTRELYYYPKDTSKVTVVGSNIDKGFFEQAGVTAAVPTAARVQPPTDLSFAPTASVDAVVAVQLLGTLSPEQRRACVAEALRVLKPGRPLVFVERLAGQGLPLRPLVAGRGGSLPLSEVEAWRALPGVELVEWDVAMPGLDPHVAGVAIKAEVGAGGNGSREGSTAGAAGRKRSKGEAKGFT